MKEQDWFLDRLKELEKLAEEMGHEGVVLGLEHALLVCAEEAEQRTESRHLDPKSSTLTAFNANDTLSH